MKNCIYCERIFETDDALQMHMKSKHLEYTPKKILVSKVTKKRLKIGLIITVVITALVGLFYVIGGESPSVNMTSVPKGAIHWHPHLTILINGQEQLIPIGIGMGAAHLPIHTHENDGTLHMENQNPSLTTVRLGYFFKVWDKTFDNSCIFEYCTDKGTLTMTVNGKNNMEWGDYVMQDKDQIVITYVSNN